MEDKEDKEDEKEGKRRHKARSVKQGAEAGGEGTRTLVTKGMNRGLSGNRHKDRTG